MQAMYWIITFVGAAGILSYRCASLLVWTASAAVLLGIFQHFSTGLSLIPWVVLGLLAALLNVRYLRRNLLSRYILVWFRSVLPPLSDTEKDAIDAGTTWWDAEIFSGRPDWDNLLQFPAPQLTEEERDFLGGTVEELCCMLDDWTITHELNDLPDEVWRFLKENRFFGMIIPKEYDGLAFSPRAQSEVVMKIASRSVSAAITVMVPNSLGPGELILHYGTEEQKRHFLPRLARGQEIPAFALTNPYAGSDAGAMPDTGVVCRETYQGKESLGFRVNWQKRYITLGPVCTLLGLAFKAVDPDGLLGDQKELGITCALVPTDTEGVSIGDRHDVGGAFQNGPNSGENVFVPIDWIIGGLNEVGHGWKMLMNCLTVGRAISLPALGTATGKLTSRTTGAYARIRKQFKVPIGKFEGVEEALARIAGLTYRMDAARLMTAVALNQGEKPAVLSAILKYHNTEAMRQVINDAMDVHGGRGVCGGPRNYLQNVYQITPVAITVEGANILTRSMIIFGQGAIRCHPYVLEEMRAATHSDPATGLKRFDAALFAHIGFTVSNAVRALVLGITGARLTSAPRVAALRRYYRQLSRMSAAFAFVADVAMLTLGGKLKRRERLSACLGDVLSHLYMASAVLKHFQDEGGHQSDQVLAEWAVQDSLFTIQARLDSVLNNFPSRILGGLMKLIVFPLGRTRKPPSDELEHRVATVLLEPSAARDRLTAGMFFQRDEKDPVGLLEIALEHLLESEPLESIVRRATGMTVGPSNSEVAIEAAIDTGVINEVEAAKIRESMRLVAEAIDVDEFSHDADA